MSPSIYEVKRLADMLKADHPCPADVDLDDWIDHELTELRPLHLRRQALIRVIKSDYYAMLVEKALDQSSATLASG